MGVAGVAAACARSSSSAPQPVAFSKIDIVQPGQGHRDRIAETDVREGILSRAAYGQHRFTSLLELFADENQRRVSLLGRQYVASFVDINANCGLSRADTDGQ